MQGSATPPMSVTIFVGDNDAALLGGNGEKQHVPMEEYKENLRKIVLHIKVLFSTVSANNTIDVLFFIQRGHKFLQIFFKIIIIAEKYLRRSFMHLKGHVFYNFSLA